MTQKELKKKAVDFVSELLGDHAVDLTAYEEPEVVRINDDLGYQVKFKHRSNGCTILIDGLVMDKKTGLVMQYFQPELRKR
ncbi:MAG: hypothetical protein WC992_03055 [Acholeplasmataceae bacterium]|jgi:hypothetical protein